MCLGTCGSNGRRDASEEDIEYVRKHYGFDRPLVVQYADWAYKAIRGDFGMSIYLNVQ